MYIFDIRGLIDNTATIYTKIEVLPKVAGESTITLTNENSVKSWVYSDLRIVEKQGFIGQFVARTLDGELQDIADDFNIEDREIVLYLGINSNHTAELVTQSNVTITNQSNEELITEQGDDVLTYYKLGNFFVEKPESDEVRDNTKFKSMDYTILFNSTFDPDFTDSEYTKSFNDKIEDEETVTALWLAQYTCKQVGVVLGTTTFRNSSFVIDSNQFDSGYTCRDVIKSIAKLAVTWARIGWDNKLYLDFDKQTETSESYNIITNDNYYELTTQKDVYGEVNRILMGSSIVVGNSAYVEDAQSIENNGLTELDVYDNPILYTQELREQAITSASSMLGLMYQPVEIETTGHPWLLGNELITIEDMEDNHLNTYALDRVLTYNGHIRSKISSIAKTETENTYSYQGVENNDKEIKRSRVELDRQNQLLTSTMERTTTNESNISTLQQSVTGITANISSISGDISGLQNDISIVTSNITGISSDIGSINSNISAINGDITSINGDITNINGDISSINGDISNITSDISDLSSDLNGLSVDFEDFYDNEYVQTIQDIQNQIDGVIEFWTGADVPTLNNYPANQWTTEADRQNHNGDVYTVISGQTQGASYRFIKDNNVWKWLEISDSEMGAIRELAQSAMDLATQNTSDISTINGNITTINSNVSTMQQSINNLNSTVEDLQLVDVGLQADVSGITANYNTLSNHVNSLDTEVDGIQTGFDAITTAEKTVVGNPVLARNCGEYLIKNLTIYGNTIQSGTPTSANPIEPIHVTGEHNLILYSKNLLNIPNDTRTNGTLVINSEDNIIYMNGTPSSYQHIDFDDELLTLEPGTYTMSYWVEGTTSTGNVPWIHLRYNNANADLFSFSSATTETEGSLTATVSSAGQFYLRVSTSANVTYTDYVIKVQIEKSNVATPYTNKYIAPITYSYDLNDLELYGTNLYKDFVTYNINDEKWYLTRRVVEYNIRNHNVSGFANSTDMSDYIVLTFSDIKDMKSLDDSIYSNAFEYKGIVSNISDIPEEEGLYVRFAPNVGGGTYYVYLSILKTTIGKQAGTYIGNAYLQEWVNNCDIKFYYSIQDPVTEELTDNNLISDLTYILNNAMLYKTDMVIKDAPVDNTSSTGYIGVNYLTDTIFNGIYASRSELKITQNSISTTVSETVNAVVENIDNRVTDVANTLEQNSKDLSDKINNVSDSLGEYAKQSSLVTVTNSVQEIQTALSEQILVTQQIKEDGVEKVTTTTGFTFDRDGLTIAKTGADTKTVVDEDGMTVYSTTGSEESILLNVDSQGVQTENLHVRTYTQIGSHSRLQDYEDGTAIFYIE